MCVMCISNVIETDMYIYLNGHIYVYVCIYFIYIYIYIFRRASVADLFCVYSTIPYMGFEVIWYTVLDLQSSSADHLLVEVSFELLCVFSVLCDTWAC